LVGKNQGCLQGLQTRRLGLELPIIQNANSNFGSVGGVAVAVVGVVVAVGGVAVAAEAISDCVVDGRKEILLTENKTGSVEFSLFVFLSTRLTLVNELGLTCTR